jgi:hypothetical protein
VPEADNAKLLDLNVSNELGEKVCRLLPRSGLGDDCLELGRVEKSRSVLFDCWTSGLVGGRRAKEDKDDWDAARTRLMEGCSEVQYSSWYWDDGSARLGDGAAAGNE